MEVSREKERLETNNREKQVQCSNETPVLRLTSQTSQKQKILENHWSRVFWVIFFVASMEAKINLIPHIIFEYFKFKTSDNLIG